MLTTNKKNCTFFVFVLLVRPPRVLHFSPQVKLSAVDHTQATWAKMQNIFQTVATVYPVVVPLAKQYLGAARPTTVVGRVKEAVLGKQENMVDKSLAFVDKTMQHVQAGTELVQRTLQQPMVEPVVAVTKHMAGEFVGQHVAQTKMSVTTQATVTRQDTVHFPCGVAQVDDGTIQDTVTVHFMCGFGVDDIEVLPTPSPLQDHEHFTTHAGVSLKFWAHAAKSRVHSAGEGVKFLGSLFFSVFLSRISPSLFFLHLVVANFIIVSHTGQEIVWNTSQCG
jgi:hypothetical protein